MTDYLYGYMVPSTGYLKTFELMFYLPGVIIRYPTLDSNGKYLNLLIVQNSYNVFREAEKWGRMLNVENAAQLNRTIKEGRAGDLIRVCEAQLENQIARIAEEIHNHTDNIKLVLIAGPSSSVKPPLPKD